jgi:tetratricopeptide (TPR) repeat protein
MAQKKLTRKQLIKEPDEFISFSGKAIQWATRHRRHVAAAAGIALIILAAFTVIRFFHAKSENQAFSLLKIALDAYETDRKDQSPEIAYDNAEKNFGAILAKYSGYTGGKLARTELAKISLKTGKTDRAIELYSQSINDFKNPSSFRNFALSGLGHAYTAAKDYANAVKYFEIIVQDGVELFRDEALFHLGQLYQLMGNREKSADAFRELAAKYPGSIYFELSRGHK